MPKPKQKKKKQQKPHKHEKTEKDEPAEEPEDLVPYRIQQSPVMGRYLQATRDIQPGEVILKEDPIVVGPSQESAPICIGCYTSIDFDTAFRCNDCKFPLCSKSCTGLGKPTGHSKEECSILASTPLKNLPASSLKRLLDIIAPLRCLIKKESDPEGWAKIMEMEHHSDIRRATKSLWDSNQKNVVDVIRNELGLVQFDEETIHRICGVLEVNCFEVGSELRGIYPESYLFAHCCIPNTRHADDAQFNITFRAISPIARNDTLFVTYTFILQGTQKRQYHLKTTKFFDCKCARCLDPTECGTNISALKCPMCEDGLVLSTAPLDPLAAWKCTAKECSSFIMMGPRVLSIVNRIYIELEDIDGNDVEGYENFLRKHSKTLHENHFLLISAMHALFQLYGKIRGYMIHDLTDEQLLRKIELCKILLEVFNKLEPGYSRQRGWIFYEQHAPMMILFQRYYVNRKAGKMKLKIMLKEIIKCLEMANKIASLEPEGSKQREIAAASKEALQKIQSWKSVLNNL